MREKIAEFVRTQRAKRRINQTELGNIAGVTIRTIQKIEAGEKIKDSTIDVVISALGYKLVWDLEIVKKNANESEDVHNAG